MKLYEYNTAINDLIDFETGEILDLARFEQLQMDEREKIKSCVRLIQNLKGEIAVIANESKRLQGHKKAKTVAVESIRSYLLYHLQAREMKKFKDELFSLTVSERDSVEIIDESQLPKKYFITKKVVELDKKAIETALKAGKKVKGAVLAKKPVLTIR